MSDLAELIEYHVENLHAIIAGRRVRDLSESEAAYRSALRQLHSAPQEWHVESIGGGESGSAAVCQRWLDEWRDEHGSKYTIHVRKRSAPGEWQDATLADLEYAGK